VGHPFNKQYRTRAAILTAIGLLGLSILAACGPSPNAKATAGKGSDDKVAAGAKDTSVKRYNLTGRVVSIDKAAHSINVDGDEIPGFMAAMTMPYLVKDVSILDKVAPGDPIKAEIVVENDGAYLENIRPTQKMSSPKPMK
jgi:Cu/Ag efflux protein CusF